MLGIWAYGIVLLARPPAPARPPAYLSGAHARARRGYGGWRMAYGLWTIAYNAYYGHSAMMGDRMGADRLAYGAMTDGDWDGAMVAAGKKMPTAEAVG